MSQAIKFDVVDRSNLPLGRHQGSKYGPLFEAASKLNGRKVICVTHDFKRAAAYLYMRRGKDTRLAGLKFSQAGGKLWIFRAAK
jgi:hypothetical protein